MYDSNLFAKLENDTGYHKTNETEILNPFVNFMKHENTQTLADVLVQETIQMRGLEFYYIPREYVKPDMVFGEDLQNYFDKAWKFAAYLNTYEEYSGNNSFYSKFGMEVNDEINLVVNPSLFKYQVNDKEPKPGDLIYFPLDNALFEINWVEPYKPFYQVGKNAQRQIIAQKFIYSGEEINPDLQFNEPLNVSELSALDLEPVRNLDELSDTNIEQYQESKEINTEASEYVDPYYVANGRGTPFSSFE
ncbi:neck protein [Providencia phage PSTRCR_127]|nr:neck protein [Providencia phage PSTRCR_127]QQV89021.1 neck protein [Providencia phage PSTRCR_121]UGO50195.1 putative neck protein [Morganella phage vB_MmoM_Rgz1]